MISNDRSISPRRYASGNDYNKDNFCQQEKSKEQEDSMIICENKKRKQEEKVMNPSVLSKPAVRISSF